MIEGAWSAAPASFSFPRAPATFPALAMPPAAFTAAPAALAPPIALVARLSSQPQKRIVSGTASP
jgi:hypothetical protein